MTAEVVYLPPRMDPLGGASTRALREGPVWLLMKDAGVLIKMLNYLPNILLPIKASRFDDELALTLAKTPELAVQAFLFVFEIVLLVVIPISVLILPGFIIIPAVVLALLFIGLLCWPFHGPSLCYSQPPSTDNFTDERWIFVNGCMTNHSGLQDNVNRLSEKFGRNVIGIHNKSYGLVADLLECLIQRDFAYKTSDVRIAYMSLKPFLMDAAIKKVVLIGHSQGGLIVSLVLDQLLAEIPYSNISKLEIYTFGSAASHMSNPPAAFPSPTKSIASDSQRQPNGGSSPTAPTNTISTIQKQPQQIITHIEHYANEYDLVPRWGVLNSVYNIQNNRYAGSVFVRRHQSGHMFNQHYLDDMFAHPPPDSDPQTPKSSTHFLDRPISIDAPLAASRASAPGEETERIQRKTSSGLEFGTGEKVRAEKMVSVGGSGVKGKGEVLMFNRTSSGRIAGEEVAGGTVRDVSRFWKYLGGGRPES